MNKFFTAFILLILPIITMAQSGKSRYENDKNYSKYVRKSSLNLDASRAVSLNLAAFASAVLNPGFEMKYKSWLIQGSVGIPLGKYPLLGNQGLYQKLTSVNTSVNGNLIESIAAGAFRGANGAHLSGYFIGINARQMSQAFKSNEPLIVGKGKVLSLDLLLSMGVRGNILRTKFGTEFQIGAGPSFNFFGAKNTIGPAGTTSISPALISYAKVYYIL